MSQVSESKFDPKTNGRKTRDIHIRVSGLTKTFRKDQGPVLNDLSVQVARGELLYLLGHSGAGKSVFLKHLLGLIRPDKGEIEVGGIDPKSLKMRELLEYRKQFGMLFQNAALFDDFTVFENVAFPLYEHTEFTDVEIEQRVSESLTSVGLLSGYDKFPNELSGGMRKRVGLARAIVLRPSILLYDEPTTGLDPVTREMVDELIANIKDKFHLTSVVISHDIPSALRLADTIAFLDQGKIVFVGEPAQWLREKHPSIVRFLEAEKITRQVLKVLDEY